MFWVIPLKRGLSVMMSRCQLQGLVDPSPAYNHAFTPSNTYLQYTQQHTFLYVYPFLLFFPQYRDKYGYKYRDKCKRNTHHGFKPVAECVFPAWVWFARVFLLLKIHFFICLIFKFFSSSKLYWSFSAPSKTFLIPIEVNIFFISMCFAQKLFVICCVFLYLYL